VPCVSALQLAYLRLTVGLQVVAFIVSHHSDTLALSINIIQSMCAQCEGTSSLSSQYSSCHSMPC
jgi:precorrin-6B methylase 1